MVCYIAVAARPQADGNVSEPGYRPARKQYADGTALSGQAERQDYNILYQQSSINMLARYGSYPRALAFEYMLFSNFKN